MRVVLLGDTEARGMEPEGRALGPDLDAPLLGVTLPSLHLGFLTREVLQFPPPVMDVSNEVRQGQSSRRT